MHHAPYRPELNYLDLDSANKILAAELGNLACTLLVKQIAVA